MAALETPPVDIGWPAPVFSLKATDGRTYSLADVRGENGLVVMFICNHCPYVKAVLDNLVSDMHVLRQHGVGSVAIMSNDVTAYPDDSFERMQALAAEKSFPFPYLYDETQQVAKAYGAVCTPDFFGFDASLKLRYRGRLDDAGRTPKPHAKRELLEAMVQVAKTGEAPAQQWNSIGCSIKWKA